MLLLNLLGILAIGSFSLEVAVATDDLDDTLKQAIFLVKLLKSDFSQNLRSNDEIMANSTEDENSTCSLPSEEFNSTMPMNATEVTVSQVTPSTPATPHPSPPDALPAPPSVMPPGAPMMMPYANWPPMAMGYPPLSGPGRQNFPDENYRFPYRANRRRMMPDYYYFDSPAKSRGQFRRFDNDPTDNLGNTPATSQAQTTISSVSSATSEATTLHMEETTVSTTSLSTTLATPSTSILPTTKQAILTTTDSAKQSIPAEPSKQTILPTIAKSILLTTTSTKKQSSLPTTIILSSPRMKRQKRVGRKKRVPVLKATSQAQTTISSVSSATSEATTLHMEETTVSTTSLSTTLATPSTSILPTTKQAILTTADSTKQSIPAEPSKQTILPTIAKSILLTTTSTKKQSSLPTTIILSSPRTKRRKRVGRKKRVTVLKVTTTVITNRNENHLDVSRPYLRLRTQTNKTEKLTKDNIEMAQVASELKKELEGTNPEDVHASLHSNHHKSKKHKKATTTNKRTITTMKVFLQGSSRIPIPLPVNNGFCHFHPENALCGAI